MLIEAMHPRSLTRVFELRRRWDKRCLFDIHQQLGTTQTSRSPYRMTSEFLAKKIVARW